MPSYTFKEVLRVVTITLNPLGVGNLTRVAVGGVPVPGVTSKLTNSAGPEEVLIGPRNTVIPRALLVRNARGYDIVTLPNNPSSLANLMRSSQ